MTTPSKPDAAAIRDWLLHYLEDLLHLPATSISTGDPLAEYGLDSSGAVGLSADLGRWLGMELDADFVYRHPTVDAMATVLATQVTRP
ncbi:MAG: acyl carrier protein [Lentisphaerae bacterium]|nr:acyl carrier protein [Lentisphaerota bacterium]